jgi:hypothetical protein
MSKAAELAALIGSQTALSNKNLIINGSQIVAQRGTSSTGVGASTGVFPCVDRMKIFAGNTAGRATVSQVADVHDGFANALKFECTTADTSIAADEFFGMQYIIEGQDLQQLKKGTSDAESFTLSFYVKGNASATYTVEMRDLDNDRINTQTFAVTTSWNRISLTFIPDTTGAFDDDNAGSLQLSFWLHAGSTYTGGTFASNTWASRVQGNRVNSSQTSFFDSTDRTFFLTGVQLEVGETATPFEHEDYGTTLAKCQRYYQRIQGISASQIDVATGVVSGSDRILRAMSDLKVTMRASPTLSASGLTGYDGSQNPTMTIQTSYSTPNQISLDMNNGSSLTTGRAGIVLVGANAANYFDASAEL